MAPERFFKILSFTGGLGAEISLFSDPEDLKFRYSKVRGIPVCHFPVFGRLLDGTKQAHKVLHW